MNNPNIMLGQYLKEQRELKGVSIDEVVEETNIAKKYIEALENDEYKFFPAPMYVTGFLTSYIEILELDKDLVLSMYKRSLNKDQEAPLEEFYNFKTSSSDSGSIKKYGRFVIWGVLAIGVMVGVVALVSKIDFSNQNTFVDATPTLTQVSLEDLQNSESILVGFNDTLIVMDNNSQKLFTVEFLGKEKNKKVVNFKILQNQYTYKNGDILNTDVSGDGVNDLKLEIISINNRDVELSLQYEVSTKATTFFDITPYRDSIGNTTPVVVVTNVSTFNATISASRHVWVAYQADTVDEKEQLLNPNERVRFSFIDGAKVSLANAGAVTITFGEFTNVVRGGSVGETSQSLFYKKTEGEVTTLYRAQLK